VRPHRADGVGHHAGVWFYLRRRRVEFSELLHQADALRIIVAPGDIDSDEARSELHINATIILELFDMDMYERFPDLVHCTIITNVAMRGSEDEGEAGYHEIKVLPEEEWHEWEDPVKTENLLGGGACQMNI
jgi:hypothetical protein